MTDERVERRAAGEEFDEEGIGIHAEPPLADGAAAPGIRDDIDDIDEIDEIGDGEEAFDGDGASRWTAWGNLWQVPAIVLSVVLIAAGLYVAGHRAPENDFHGVLDQVDHLIASGDFDPARTILEQQIEPVLELATPVERARYYATVADWHAASQEMLDVQVPEYDRVIADRYARAVEQGLLLTPLRVERWAEALIELGEIPEARKRLDELEALAVTDAQGPDARARRNRLLRRMVEFSLAQENLPLDAVMEELEGYRAEPMISAADEAWAVAREAELRLEAGLAPLAVDRLLVDMRRLEDRDETLGPLVWAELYTLLGRGYYDQGRDADARYNLEQALARCGEAHPLRSEALLVLGRIDIAEGRLEDADERLQEVTLNYQGTPAYLPALLARGELSAVRGDHATALAAYREVILRRPEAAPRRDLTAQTIASSLADRHDAALTLGDLPLALEYVSLAEEMFGPGDVPPEVLRRIASTSRQIADDLLAQAAVAEPGRVLRVEEIAPEIRHEAAENYERAGAYFVRHARAVATVPNADADWASSLWLGADSYDLAGLRPEAIKLFQEYIAGRPVDDPRRAEVTFRLAQAYQAERDFESAVRYYLQVLDEHPRSPFGTGCHVPLARCYVALDRGSDAVQQLLAVVDGRQGDRYPLVPEAMDYRDALIELGTIYHESGQNAAAIERLTAAADRYPNDERIDDIRFRLADAHARLARELRAGLEAEPNLSPDEREKRALAVREHLRTALDLFTLAGEGYARIDERRLTPAQRDSMRHAALYRADCAFDLEEYELAAQLYDQAARKYSGHHASMHALVQIINCFDRLGNTRDADIAHHNAMIRLRQLPDSAFDDPEALMDRTAWERWLRNRPVGATADARTEPSSS